MRIAGIEVTVVRGTEAKTRDGVQTMGTTDNRQQTALVTVRTDEGEAGYGEANANPFAIKTLIESEFNLPGGWDDGIKDLLIGEDPSDPDALWAKLVGSTFWSCRTGLGHALEDNTADNREAVRLVKQVREHVGDDFTLLLDVGYRWKNFEEARDCARELDGFGLALLETPFPPENVEAYRRLSEHIQTPLAGADILTSYHDYVPLLDSGAVRFLQAGACRTGISDMNRLARIAFERGKRFGPWGWCATTFTASANLHLSAAHDNVPLIEHAPPSIYPEATLRAHLAGPEPPTSNGLFKLPSEPGLGVELNEDALATFRVG